MYSTAEATTPDMGPPGSVILFIDMTRPRCLVVHSRTPTASNVDLDQRSTVSRATTPPWRDQCVSRPPSTPRRAHSQRPRRRRATKKRDELAPLHVSPENTS